MRSHANCNVEDVSLKRLGLSLFARGPGKTSLTAKGRELLPMARETLNHRDAFLIAADAPEVLDGVLRLGVSEVVAHSWLKPFIAAFAQALPSVRVELTVELSRDLLERMQDGELLVRHGACHHWWHCMCIVDYLMERDPPIPCPFCGDILDL